MCYGDSLTWGYNPRDGTRYEFDQRWPGVLQGELGSGFRVIEEALNGRTTVTESWLLPNRSGRVMLGPLLESHAPIDLCILMLGTNDVGPSYHLTASEVAFGCLALIWTMQKSQAGPAGGAPEILLIAPPPLGEVSGLMELFYNGGEEASRALAKAYKTVADASGCHFLDASKYLEVSKIDGVHLDPPAHRTLAMEIKKMVTPMLAKDTG
ncbi:MAG: SGNH/GDSL hydrolase family protein [Candidatus Entotheonellia bacterium]